MSLGSMFGLNPSSRVTITDLALALARLEGSITTFINVSQDHEQRIRALERWRYGIPATGVTAVGAFLMSWWKR